MPSARIVFRDLYSSMLLNRVDSPAGWVAALLALVVVCGFCSAASSGSSQDGMVREDEMLGSRQLVVVTVDQSGRGDHRRIQDAIDAAPANDDYSGSSVVIRIKPGVYRQKVVVDKPGITLVGTSASSTVITWNESWATAESPTVSVLASDFITKRITVAGDRAAFYGCRFVSFQDTLLDDTGRHYYRGCYV
ncbi:hypothetical protein HU200_047429 [Digitaria exilis]|uniref:pectinesterase n=1 Tax=Digitaria exilis TaxID=1010633 RepID=A0A835B2N0_9POAL|nr:hypothetical protein HU200_047429 [Digitaria exilis]